MQRGLMATCKVCVSDALLITECIFLFQLINEQKLKIPVQSVLGYLSEQKNPNLPKTWTFQHPFESFPVSHFVPPGPCEVIINKILSSGASY